jgi:hypothetical protein
LKIFNRKVFQKVKRIIISSAIAEEIIKKTLPANKTLLDKQGYE